MPPDLHYARTADGVHIAYSVLGEGPALVFCPPMVWAIEWAFEDPSCSRYLNHLAEFSRLIVFDKRGTGHSDPMLTAPSLEQRADDMLAVMDASMTDTATVFGCSEGGSMALLFAATHPERVTGLISWATCVRIKGRLGEGAPFVAVPEVIDMWPDMIEKTWGTGQDLVGGPLPGSPEARVHARRQQLAASPAMARATAVLDAEIDVRAILPSVRVPTLVMHRAGEQVIRPEHGRYIAENIEGARYVELPGNEHFPWSEDFERALAETQEFITGVRPDIETDRVLSTVMFTDLVSSTDHAARMRDSGWKDVLEAHDRTIRAAVERHRGRYVKSTGDGSVSTFDGASRAVRCAKDIIRDVEKLGLEVRVGVHAGEIALTRSDIGGISVHIAQRVSELAAAGEVVVSSTVRDLAVGSGIYFIDRGLQTLKGVPDPWRVYLAKLA